MVVLCDLAVLVACNNVILDSAPGHLVYLGVRYIDILERTVVCHLKMGIIPTQPNKPEVQTVQNIKFISQQILQFPFSMNIK